MFTSGDDIPGMNAALYAITKAADANGIKTSGICKGYEELIDDDLILLKSTELQKVIQKVGTLLKKAHSKRFMELEGRKLVS